MKLLVPGTWNHCGLPLPLLYYYCFSFPLEVFEKCLFCCIYVKRPGPCTLAVLAHILTVEKGN